MTSEDAEPARSVRLGRVEMAAGYRVIDNLVFECILHTTGKETRLRYRRERIPTIQSNAADCDLRRSVCALPEQPRLTMAKKKELEFVDCGLYTIPQGI